MLREVVEQDSTQGTVAQSPAESELIATVCGAMEGLDLISLAQDFGLEFEVCVHVNAKHVFCGRPRIKQIK